MRATRFGAVVLAFSAIAAVLGACGDSAKNGEQGSKSGADNKAPITIGMVASLTGGGARFGQSQQEGVQLAIDEINQTGGIKGRRVELVAEDTKTQTSTAVTAFVQVTEKHPEMLALIGSSASLDVPAYLDRVDPTGIPHLLPVAVLPAITEKGSKWTFRTALNDKIAAAKMAEFAVNRLQAKKIALLIEDSAFGETGLIFGAEIERLGVKPLTTERLKRGDLDVRPQLTKIRSLGATHIQFWGYYAEYALVAKQMRELGYDLQLMGNQAPVNDKTIELAGKAIEGALNVCLFVPTAKSPRIQDFVSRFQKRYNTLPDTWAAQAYDGMQLLAKAIESSDGTRQGVRDAIAATKDFEGITGVINFLPSGDAAFRGTSVVQVVDGRFVPFEK